jgi:hypothetical protein
MPADRSTQTARFHSLAFSFLAVQVVVAAAIIGFEFASWWWFGGVLIGLTALVSMPGVRRYGAFGLALAAAVAMYVGAGHYVPTIIAVLIGAAAFAVLGTLNAAGARHQDQLDALDAAARNGRKRA